MCLLFVCFHLLKPSAAWNWTCHIRDTQLQSCESKLAQPAALCEKSKAFTTCGRVMVWQQICVRVSVWLLCLRSEVQQWLLIGTIFLQRMCRRSAGAPFVPQHWSWNVLRLCGFSMGAPLFPFRHKDEGLIRCFPIDPEHLVFCVRLSNEWFVPVLPHLHRVFTEAAWTSRFLAHKLSLHLLLQNYYIRGNTLSFLSLEISIYCAWKCKVTGCKTNIFYSFS